MAAVEKGWSVDLMQWLSWPLKLAFFLVREVVRVVGGDPRWPDPPESGSG